MTRCTCADEWIPLAEQNAQHFHDEADHLSDCHGRFGEPSSFCGGCYSCIRLQVSRWWVK